MPSASIVVGHKQFRHPKKAACPEVAPISRYLIISSENSAVDTTANSDTKMLEDTEAATAVVPCFLQGLITQGIISEGLTETAEDFMCSYFARRNGAAVHCL